MRPIGFSVKIVAPYFPAMPPEIGEKWLKRIKEAAPKAYKNIKKAIKTRQDFKDKIAEPTEKTIASFIDPKFVSDSGRTYRNIMDKTRHSLKRAGKNYLRRVKAVYETGRYDQTVEYGRKEYARKWCQLTGPLRGYKKGGVKGLSALGVMALCGDPGIKDLTIEGIPINIAGRPGFKRLLANRIVRWGTWIIESGYDEPVIKEANEKLNRLVNEYCREDIVSFNPGGISHIDFIAVEIPNPLKPGEMMKQLGLEIQVSEI